MSPNPQPWSLERRCRKTPGGSGSSYSNSGDLADGWVVIGAVGVIGWRRRGDGWARPDDARPVGSLGPMIPVMGHKSDGMSHIPWPRHYA